MNRYQVFDKNQLIGDCTGFPDRYSWPESCVICDTWAPKLLGNNIRAWWMIDATPLHIDSVPKETRAMALLLGIA